MIFLFFLILSSALGSSSSVCYTKSCLKSTKKIASWMNASVDPCHDFYQFSCGGYISKYKNNDLFKGWSSLHLIGLKNLKLIQQILEKNASSFTRLDGYTTYDRKGLRKAQSFYESCKSETRNVFTSKVVSGFMENVQLSQLATSDGKLNRGALGSTLGRLAKLGSNVFFSSIFDVKEIVQSKLPSYITLKPALEDWPLMENTSSRNPVDATEFTSKFLSINNFTEVGSKIQSLHMKLFNEFNKSSRAVMRMRLGDLSRTFQSFDLIQYFENLLTPHDYSAYVNYNITIQVDPEYFNALDAILLTTSVDSIRGSIQNIDTDFSGFSAKNAQLATSRRLLCSAVTLTYFSKIIDRFFLLSLLEPSSIFSMKIMLDSVKYSLRKRIKSLDWLDESTRMAAIRKLDAMGSHIAKPDYVDNPKEIWNGYASIPIDPNDFYGNLAIVRTRSSEDQLKIVFGKKGVPKWWGYSTSIINAFNSIYTNDIVIPAGIMQNPFFNPENPAYLNFGSLGFIIGHELTHGFDDKGALRDETGVEKNWWTNSTFDAFTDHSKCMVNQYQNYSMNIRNKTISVDGKYTLGENIADNGGLQSAYDAWVFYRSNDVFGQQNKDLPGLDYTPEQLFFISFAQTWCRIPSDAIELNDVHAPNEMRVKGVLSNFHSFSSAFNCKPTDAMNPDQKCNIWK